MTQEEEKADGKQRDRPPAPAVAERRDGWDKAAVVGQIAAGFGTPVIAAVIALAVAYFGFRIDTAISQQEGNREMVTMAVDILRQSPSEQNDPVAREWALSVMNEYSAVPFPEEMRENLRTSSLPARRPTERDRQDLYGSYTDGANYTRLSIGHDGREAFIRSEGAGIGSVNDVDLVLAPFRGGGVDVGNYVRLTEMERPSGRRADTVRIYAEDGGSGKTRLMAVFGTGDAQQIAVEP